MLAILWLLSIYTIKKRSLTYLGLDQTVEEESNFKVQKTFSLTDGDVDSVNQDRIIGVIEINKYTVNSRGQYIIESTLIGTNFDM